MAFALILTSLVLDVQANISAAHICARQISFEIGRGE